MPVRFANSFRRENKVSVAAVKRFCEKYAGETSVLSHKGGWTFEQEWRQVFGNLDNARRTATVSPGKAWAGIWLDMSTTLKDARAEEEYVSLSAADFFLSLIMLCNSKSALHFQMKDAILPSLSDLKTDLQEITAYDEVCLTSDPLKWTFVLSHESSSRFLWGAQSVSRTNVEIWRKMGKQKGHP